MANDIRLFLSPLVTKLQKISIACTVLLMICTAISLRAQIRSATITGIVADPKGAVVVAPRLR